MVLTLAAGPPADTQSAPRRRDEHGSTGTGNIGERGGRGNQPRDITITHNTIDHDGTTVLYAHGGTATSPERIIGFEFSNNAARHNAYGINGASASSGNLAISMYFPDGFIRGNWLAGGSASRYPVGNLFAGAYEAAFIGAGVGDYRPSGGSVLLGAAVDGGNIGADMPRLLAGVSGVMLPLAPASIAPASMCTTQRPVSNWVCVNGGWVPPDHPLALSALATSPPPSSGGYAAPAPPTPVPVSTATCSTQLPAPGWVCVSTGWVPPNHPLALSAGSTVAPTTALPTPISMPSSGSGACTTTLPAAGWVCVNGGWVPPDHPLARGT